MQAKLQEQFSATDAEVIWGPLPEPIQAAPIARAGEIEYPIAAAIAISIALISTHVTPTPLTLSRSIFEHSSIPLPLEYSYLPTADRPSTSGYSHQLRHLTI